ERQGVSNCLSSAPGADKTCRQHTHQYRCSQDVLTMSSRLAGHTPSAMCTGTERQGIENIPASKLCGISSLQVSADNLCRYTCRQFRHKRMRKPQQRRYATYRYGGSWVQRQRHRCLGKTYRIIDRRCRSQNLTGIVRSVLNTGCIQESRKQITYMDLLPIL